MTIGISKVTGTIMNAVSIANGGTTFGTALNAAAGERYDHLVFQVKLTFNSSATAGAVIHRRKSTDDGSTLTNVGTDFLSVDVNTGTPQVVEFELSGADYLEVCVENLDANYSLTGTITYEGTKITGLG